MKVLLIVSLALTIAIIAWLHYKDRRYQKMTTKQTLGEELRQEIEEERKEFDERRQKFNQALEKARTKLTK